MSPLKEMLLQFSIRMNFESRTIEMSVLRKVEFSPEDLSIISDRNLLIDFIIIYFLIRSKESEVFKQIFHIEFNVSKIPSDVF